MTRFWMVVHTGETVAIDGAIFLSNMLFGGAS